MGSGKKRFSPTVLALFLLAAAFPARAADAPAEASPAQEPDAPAANVAVPYPDAGKIQTRDFSKNDSARADWVVLPNLPTRRENAAAGKPGDDASPDAARAPYLGVVDAVHGESLRVPAVFPGTLTLARGSYEKPVYFAFKQRYAQGAALDALGFSLYVPDALPPRARLNALVFVKEKDGRWFQAPACWRGTARAATALRPGWNELSVELGEGAAQFRPQGHGAAWNRYRLSQTVQYGIIINCDAAFAGEIAIDDVWVRYATPEERPLRLTGLRLPEKMVQNRLYEIGFNVTREIINPFCPEEIDIVADFTAPGAARAVSVPAFYYQDFLREKGADDGRGDYRDRYTPTGPAEFRVRYLPPRPGAYRVTIRVKHTCPFTGKVTEYASPELTAEAVANDDPSSARRYVRASAADRHYFEFENGEWFYPLGLNMHNPIDVRHHDRILKRFFPGRPLTVDRGLRCYEDAFAKMAANGMNAFEVWMSSWWLGLEWTSKWKGFQGLGRYNLENAWKLDALLEAAAAKGMYAHLVVDNHGKGVSGNGREGEWRFSPYNNANRRDGGFCRGINDFFSSPRALTHYRDFYRYIAARWGWCPNIFGVEMWSELNLVSTNVRSDMMYKWHAEMEKAFHQWDQGNHLMTTHYSGDFNTIDLKMDEQPSIGYIVGDAYHSAGRRLADLMLGSDNRLTGLGKPFVITEFGGNWDVGDQEILFGDIFCSMWLTWTTRAGGSPFCWWYAYVLDENMTPYYGAFARYIKGEDKRRPAGAPPLTVRNARAADQGSGEKLAELEKLAEADKNFRMEKLTAFNREKSRLENELKKLRGEAKKAETELAARREKLKKEPSDALKKETADRENALKKLRDDAGAAEKSRKDLQAGRDKDLPNRPQRLTVRGTHYSFFMPDNMRKAQELAAGITDLCARVLGDGKTFYGYIFDPVSLSRMPLTLEKRPLFAQIDLQIDDLPPGRYTVEIWDCWQGKIIENSACDAGERGGMISLPDFRTHIALKLRRQE